MENNKSVLEGAGRVATVAAVTTTTTASEQHRIELSSPEENKHAKAKEKLSELI